MKKYEVELRWTGAQKIVEAGSLRDAKRIARSHLKGGGMSATISINIDHPQYRSWSITSSQAGIWCS